MLRHSTVHSSRKSTERAHPLGKTPREFESHHRVDSARPTVICEVATCVYDLERGVPAPTKHFQGHCEEQGSSAKRFQLVIELRHNCCCFCLCSTHPDTPYWEHFAVCSVQSSSATCASKGGKRCAGAVAAHVPLKLPYTERDDARSRSFEGCAQ